MVTYGVVWLNERVVDGNDLNVTVLDTVLQSALIVSSLQSVLLLDSRIAEDDTSNSAEAVDTALLSVYQYVFPYLILRLQCSGSLTLLTLTTIFAFRVVLLLREKLSRVSERLMELGFFRRSHFVFVVKKKVS